MVVPELTGVEIFHLLRSAAAPERFVIGYGGGVTLRELKEGGVDVLRDGKMVARVSPPKAWDADRQEVPMRLRADGDRLIVEVEHRAGDFNYPIVADPAINEDFAYLDGRTAWWDDVGWGRVSTAAPYGGPRRFYEDQQCTDTGGRFCFGHWPGWIFGTGLYTWMRSGVTPGFDNAYNYGDMGEWVFQAPGQSYIFRFDMWQLRNESGSSCSYQGLYSDQSDHWEEQSYWDPWGGQHTPARPGGSYAPRMNCGTSDTEWLTVCAGQWECQDGEADYARHIREGGNYVVFGTQIFGSPIPAFTNFMGAANISIGDRDNPQISNLTGPTGWTRDPAAQITVRAEDPGLGVRQLKLSAPEQPAWNGTRDTEPVCNGDRHSRCATWREHTVDVGDLPEGQHRVVAEAVDPVDRRDLQDITVKIDRTKPTVALSGSIYDERSPAVLTPGDGDLSILANGGGSNHDTSGVRSVDVTIDGVDVLRREQVCSAGGCDLSALLTLNTVDYLDGQHQVRVRADDQAGNVSVREFSFIVGEGAVQDYGQADDGSCGLLEGEMVDDCSDNESQMTALATAPAFGISDNNPTDRYNPFVDPDFAALGVIQVRRIVAYNIALFAGSGSAAPGSNARKGYDDYIDVLKWLRAAAANGKKVLMSVDKCRFPSPGVSTANYCETPPDYADYRAGVNALFTVQSDNDPTTREFGDVALFGVWNESNKGLRGSAPSTPPPPGSKDSPLAFINTGADKTTTINSGAYKAGVFARYLDTKCRMTNPDRCSVVAGEFLDADMANASSAALNASMFLRQFRQGLNRKPKFWGWHPYRDGLRAPSATSDNRWSRLRSFERATRPDDGSASPPIWLTEGGAIREVNGSTQRRLKSDQQAARVIKAYTSDSASAWRVVGRVDRFYLYQMVGESRFDSGIKEYQSVLPGDLRQFARRPLSFDAYCKRTDPMRTC